jgi:hypothetical protein
MKINEGIPTKIRVRFLECIAGLGDPDKTHLDRKYDQLLVDLTSREKGPTRVQIAARIAELKIIDRYEGQSGFKRDFVFRPGEEVFIPEKAALDWQNCGVCEILPEPKTV